MTEKENIFQEINDEINELQYYKRQLRRFLFLESVKSCITALNFNLILDEIERVRVEITHLEYIKKDYYNID